jgi:hypothetical protein
MVVTVIQTLNAAVPSHIFGIILGSVRSYNVDLFHAKSMFLMINFSNLSSLNFFIFSRINCLFNTCRFTDVHACSHILSTPGILSHLNIKIFLILRFFRFRGTFLQFGRSCNNLCSWKVILFALRTWTI